MGTRKDPNKDVEAAQWRMEGEGGPSPQEPRKKKQSRENPSASQPKQDRHEYEG